MFSAFFINYYDAWQSRKAPQGPCAFYSDCSSYIYAIKTISEKCNHISKIEVLKSSDSDFVPLHQFCAKEFCGAFFANIREETGESDDIDYRLSAEVYDFAAFPVGRLTLVNNFMPFASDIWNTLCLASDRSDCQ